MNSELEKVCDSLDGLATAVKNAWGNDNLMVEAIGWNSPALTRHDLAFLPHQLANDIRSADPEVSDEHLLTIIQDFPRRLQLLQTHTVPQIFNGGNSPQAVPAYVGTIGYLRQVLAPLLNWQVINDPKAMPHALARRVRSFTAQLEQIAPKTDELERKIADIERAHSAAESLPVDMQALAEARKTLTESVAKAGEHIKIIEGRTTESFKKNEFMDHLKGEAEKTMALCEEAYRASTTRGLASAFDQRAIRHGWSMLGWVFGLILALVAGALAGEERVKMLSTALSTPQGNAGTIAMQALLLLASVGAPIWFAWLATKQIGQRFRLAEDYSFKASVAKAYEGYRKEAARIHPEFESRLFDSALSRLEEPPLRLVESETHGSPWHELIASDAFMKALELVPELKDKCAKLPTAGAKTVKSALNKVSKTAKPAAEKKDSEQPQA